jgi:hypothetical protein
MRRLMTIVIVALLIVGAGVGAPAASASSIAGLKAKVVRLTAERDQAIEQRDQARQDVASRQQAVIAFSTGWLSLNIGVQQLERIDDAPTSAETDLFDFRSRVEQEVQARLNQQ